jgi:phosphate-selective porin
MRIWSVMFTCAVVNLANAQEPPVAPAQDSSTAPAAVPAAPVPPVVPPALVPVVREPLPPPPPLAGYANGSFFLRDPHDWFVLFPKGRLQIDSYNFLNRGSAPAGVDSNSSKDPRPRDTIFVRRARVELQGTVMKHFDFHIAGEYASTPATGSTGTVADAYVIVDYLPFLKLQGGQFDAPFTLENRTSDKYFDFMERSLAVRAFGVPTNKEQGAMLFGWLPRKVAYYSIGVFDGDGQNFRNQDNHFAVIGRAFVAPFAPFASGRQWMEDIWVGGSFWWQRNRNPGGAVTPNVGGAAQNDLPAMATQGGFGFFSTSYANGSDTAGNSIRSHLVPGGDTVKWALEANIPLKRVGARFELVHQSVDLTQYNDTNPTNASLTRSTAGTGAKLDGYGYYVEVYGWLLGNSSFLETPGLEPAPRIKRFQVTTEPKWGLMLAAKYEHVGFNVAGLPSGAVDPGTQIAARDPAEGYYQIHAFELGLNGWATKHVRLTANYVLNYIDGDSGQVKKNFYYRRPEHELLFRLGVNL